MAMIEVDKAAARLLARTRDGRGQPVLLADASKPESVYMGLHYMLRDLGPMSVELAPGAHAAACENLILLARALAMHIDAGRWPPEER